MKLTNHTPFEAAPFVTGDLSGRESLAVVVKATFDIAPGGALNVAEEPVPVTPGDLYEGDPETTPIRVPADLCPGKRTTDLFLAGFAVPDGSKQPFVDVSFSVANRGKRVRVFGDRVWDKVLGFTKITDPAPFERMPLTWANAFGGWDRSPEDPGLHEYDARNPVGKGFRAKKSSLPTAGEPLPNLEDPANPMKKPKDRPPPAGFGPIGPHWLPRSGFTGTYDEAWVRERMPQLPDDFDARFYDRAPPELVLESAPPPGTLLTATGVSPSGPLRVELPDLRTEVQVVFLRRSKEVPLHVDTILLDAGKRQLVVAGSGLLPVEGELGDVVNIVVRPQRGGRR